MASEPELLEAWRNGDRDAGAKLFEQYYGTVRRFFINKADDAAEDLIQQTFAACLAGRERFENRSGFRAYLLGIARNLLRKHWQSRRVRGRKIDIEDVSLAELGAGPSTLLSRNRAHKRLLDALRELPLSEQIVLELYYWENLSGAELGRVLEVPEDTARSRLRRAKLNLGKVFRRLERFSGAPESSDENLENWARAIHRLASDDAEP